MIDLLTDHQSYLQTFVQDNDLIFVFLKKLPLFEVSVLFFFYFNKPRVSCTNPI